MEGYIEKKGAGSSILGRRNWKRRYFSLDDHYFTYWTKPGGKRKGFCVVSELGSPKVVDVNKADSTGTMNYISIIMKGRELLMRMDSEEERQIWLKAFETVISGKSLTESEENEKKLETSNPRSSIISKDEQEDLLDNTPPSS